MLACWNGFVFYSILQWSSNRIEHQTIIIKFKNKNNGWSARLILTAPRMRDTAIANNIIIKIFFFIMRLLCLLGDLLCGIFISHTVDGCATKSNAKLVTTKKAKFSKLRELRCNSKMALCARTHTLCVYKWKFLQGNIKLVVRGQTRMKVTRMRTSNIIELI